MLRDSLQVKILQAIRFLVGASIVTVPMVVFPESLFPYITHKTLLFYFLTEVAFFLYLILVFSDQKYLPPKNIIFSAYTVFVVAGLLSTVFAIDPIFSFWSNSVRMDGLLTILHLLAFFTVLLGVIRTRLVLHTFVWLSVSTAIFITATVYLGTNGFNVLNSLVTGSFRSLGFSGGLIGNDSYTGVYMLLNLFLILYLYINSKINWQKGILFAFALFILCSPLFLNFAILQGSVSLQDILANPLVLIGTSRAAFLGIFIGVVLMSVLYLNNSTSEGNKRISKYTFTSLVLGIVLTLVLTFFPGTTLNTKFGELTGGYRNIYQSQAISGFKDKPLFGWGPGSFSAINTKYFNPKSYDEYPNHVELNADKAHNIVFDTLAEKGLAGIFALFFLFLATLVFLFKAKKITWKNKTIFFGALAGYFIQSLTFFDVLVSSMTFVLFLTIVISLETDEKTPRLYKFNPSKLVVSSLIVTMPIALFFMLRFFVVLPINEINNNFYFYNTEPAYRINLPITDLDVSAFGAGDEEGYIFAYVLNKYDQSLPQIKSLQDPSIFLKDLEKMEQILLISKYDQHLVVKYNLLFRIAMLQYSITGNSIFIDKMKDYVSYEIAVSPNHPIGYMNKVQVLNLVSSEQVEIERLHRKIIELNPSLNAWVLKNKNKLE